jgi:hypothetical protein
MKSATLPSFWATYARLDEDTKRSARKWYRKALSLQLDEGERAFLVFEGVDYISLSPA